MMLIINNGGELDRRVTFQARTLTKDATYGAPVESFADLATVWCKVLETTEPGEQTAKDGQGTSMRRLELGIRWRADVRTEMRARLDDGSLLQITGAAMLGRRQWLQISCTEWRHQQP